MKKILYIDMDNVLVDFQSGIEQLPHDIRVQYEDRFDEVPGIFGLMQPLNGAIESFNELAGLFDTYILSTSPWDNPTAWSDKLMWVKKYLGQNGYRRLILSHYKNLNAGDYLIDDRLKNGVDQFKGEHIHFGTESFPDWTTVTQYLRSRSEYKTVSP